MADDPGFFSSKAVSQYRTRDIFGYLSLRYYLDASASRTDSWARVNARQIVLASHTGRYFESLHFKGVDEEGRLSHRSIYIPSPSEALTEAVVIDACREHWEAERSSCLFSYLPAPRADRHGYFLPYMHGLRERQIAIAAACRTAPPGAVVQYLDIKSFYPSIRPDLARKTWSGFCERNGIAPDIRAVGAKLIDNHSFETGKRSVLTGPMITHFLANLVLSDLDKAFESGPVSYFRYVDDITLVGRPTEVMDTFSKIQSMLGEIGLKLHSLSGPKSMTVPVQEWVSSQSDFTDSAETSAWVRLVGNIKKLLLISPKEAMSLEDALRASGFRFPVPDYSTAVSEASSFEKIKRLGLWVWLLMRSGRANASSIISDARELRDRLERETLSSLKQVHSDSPFQRKRRVSKLKYRLGRLLYLSSPDLLTRLSLAAENIPELRYHVAVMRAIVSTDCSEVARLGANAAQATAQIFRAMGETARFSEPLRLHVEVQSLAIFLLNGVSVEAATSQESNDLIRFARDGADIGLMKAADPFLSEISALHGIGEPRHPGIIKTAFDFDQDIALDALQQEYGYSI